MAVSTSGIEVGSSSRRLREAIELLSSMRFAIALLTLICIASVIGTVVKQNEPFNNYVNQFGPFWADVYAQVNLYTVYSAPWFLLILAFLVVSTSLCIARNTPKILADLRQFKEDVREKSLLAFKHKGQARSSETPDAALARVSELLVRQGWMAKVQQRPQGVMVAARKGRPNKIGYLAAHSSIVLICIGGLLDGDLVVRTQMWLFDKEVYPGSGLINEVPEKHRMSVNSPTYRGNLFVPEGVTAGTAVLSMPGGVVLQPLPFDVELKRFIVEYYSTGMPKLFASDIVVHDRGTGEKFEHRVEVNKPAFHRGVAIYQSGFEDGGSRVKLKGVPLYGEAAEFEIEGRIGDKAELVATKVRGGEDRVNLEFGALRVINVENMGTVPTAPGSTDVRGVDLGLGHAIESRLGSGIKVTEKKNLVNVGPSITYKLRDAAGQAKEFHNYMAPVMLDGSNVFLVGSREEANTEFRYMRVPADEEFSLKGWLLLKRALDDPALREQAARRYAKMAAPADKPEIAEQLFITTRRTLALFAGAEPSRPPGTHGAAPGTETAPNGAPVGGLQALSDFMESSVPEAERMKVSGVLIRVLNGALFELYNVAREKAGVKPLEASADAERFMALAITSISDSFFYPAPIMFQLVDFTQVQASIFQVARAPGKTIVYLGCFLLIVGVFVMLYVRDRRLWVWLAPAPGGEGTQITTALSSTRRTLDGDAEFERLKHALLQTEEKPA